MSHAIACYANPHHGTKTKTKTKTKTSCRSWDLGHVGPFGFSFSPTWGRNIPGNWVVRGAKCKPKKQKIDTSNSNVTVVLMVTDNYKKREIYLTCCRYANCKKAFDSQPGWRYWYSRDQASLFSGFLNIREFSRN